MMRTYMHFDKKINQSFIFFISIWFKIFIIHELYNKVMEQPKRFPSYLHIAFINSYF